MKRSHVAPLFYLGILISSVGTGAFANSLMAFMLLSHFPLAEAALLIGLQRLIPTLAVAGWGHWTDRWSPRATIIAAEITAAFVSLGLIVVWRGEGSSVVLIGLLSVARAVIVSFQLGSRAKISKLLSGSTYAGNSKHAMWLNKVTQGASLFSGALAWIFVTYSTLEIAILFDLLTFMLNGVIVYFMPKLDEAEFAPKAAVELAAKLEKVESWYTKFRELVQFNSSAVLFDVFLFASTGGLVAYSARVSGTDPAWTGLFVAAYGLAVWAAGFSERTVTARFSTVPFWIGIGLAYIVLGQFERANALAVAVSFVKDFCFWVIFHRVSANVQMNTPFAKMGSVSSARSVLIVVISAGAEILVGAWSKVISLPVESGFRAALVFGFAGYLLLSVRPREESLDRPRL